VAVKLAANFVAMLEFGAEGMGVQQVLRGVKIGWLWRDKLRIY
jgi:hypothetical protein